jgi:REP-associated tyrosine transposase
MHPRRRIRLGPANYQQPGRIFSVTIATKNRLPIFLDVPFGRKCVAALRTIPEKSAVRVYAYCLMPDHVHLLIGIAASSSLLAVVGGWKSVCSRIWREAEHGGSFWQRSFFDHALRQEEDLRVVARYILWNPVRAGLVTRVRDYELCGSMEFDLSEMS